MCRSVTDIQQEMRRQGVRGNYTNSENLHLTLAFIGDYPDPNYVLDVLDTVSFRPFKLRLEGFGCFGDLWWTGLGKSDSLQALAKQIRHTLSDADIPFDRKKFSPHITLIRRASFVIRPQIIVPSTEMSVRHFGLFRSDRGKNGMIYTELGTIPAI